MKNITVIAHPLVRLNLVRLRDRRTQREEFTRALEGTSALVACEAIRAFDTEQVASTTLPAGTRAQPLRRKVISVPELPAGHGRYPAAFKFIPHARLGFIGLARREGTLRASVRRQSLPRDFPEFEMSVIAPMLVTGL